MSSLSLFPEWLKEYQECVERELKSQFAKPKSTLEASAFEAISHGKRLRAVLSLLWCEAICGDYTRASEISAAYELAHCAALIQDDIMDGSDMRRGESSLMGKYGTPGAILAANTLLFYVPKLISEFSRKSGDALQISKLLDLFGECYRSSSLGEHLDLELANSSTVSEKSYEEMVKLKTGSLIGAASASGALIGGGDWRTVSAAYDYGASLGVAYQIQDDMLDIFGDEHTMGKPAFNDIANGKKSLMIIRFFNVCQVESEAEFMRHILKRREPITRKEEILLTREILLKYNCEAYAKEFAARYIHQAEESLEVLKSSTARERLSELSSLLAARNY